MTGGGETGPGGPPTVSTTSSGRWRDSRAMSERFTVPRGVRASATGPLPVTSGVTSSETHVPAANGPELATIAGPGTGAVAGVSVPSDHELDATGRTSNPVVEADRV